MPPLHPHQEEIKNDNSRFKVLACGRRWGKTQLCSALAIAEMIKGNRIFWISPTYSIGKEGWRIIVNLAGQLGAKINKTEKIVEYGGGKIELKTQGNQPHNLRGAGLDLAIIDEAAFVNEDLWREVLRPSLIDKKGKAIFISTPKGRNWFFDLFHNDQYKSWRFTSFDNPFLPPEEIDQLKKTLSEREYKQEILAEFVDFEGKVFPAISDDMIFKGEPQPPYYFGIDWGQRIDFTAIVGLDKNANMFFLQQTQKDYDLQLKQVKAILDQYKPEICMVELNSMGQVLFDELLSEGYGIQGFTTTAKSKKQLIDNITIALERGELKIFDDAETKKQFDVYQSKQTYNGIRFSAPEGSHDDIVMATSLALHAMDFDDLGWQ